MKEAYLIADLQEESLRRIRQKSHSGTIGVGEKKKIKEIELTERSNRKLG